MKLLTIAYRHHWITLRLSPETCLALWGAYTSGQTGIFSYANCAVSLGEVVGMFVLDREEPQRVQQEEEQVRMADAIRRHNDLLERGVRVQEEQLRRRDEGEEWRGDVE